MADNNKILEWNNLSMTDRAKYIKTGVESGLSNMEDIKKAYKIYAGGGPMEEPQLQDDSLEENSDIENVPIRKTSIPIGKTPNIPIKRKYDSYTPIEIQEDTDNYKERDVVFHYRNMPYNEIDEAVEALFKEGATKAQIAGMLGNAAHESNMRGGKQIGGPARGYFQLEAGHRNKYEKYLKDNNLQDNLANEAVYAFRYTNNNTSNKTPYESQDSKIWRDRWSKHSVYQGITTKDAYRKWNQNNPDSTSDAFLNLFEKAGVPSDQIRRDYSSKFYFDKNINWEEYFPNIKAKGGPLDSEVYIDHSYVPYKPMNPEEYAKTIINPVFQHQSDNLQFTEKKKIPLSTNSELRAQDNTEQSRDYFNNTTYARRLNSEAKKNRWIEETRLGKTYKDIKEPLLFTPLAPVVYGGESLYSTINGDIIGNFINGISMLASSIPVRNRIPESIKEGFVKGIDKGIDKGGELLRLMEDQYNLIRYKNKWNKIINDSHNRNLKKYEILSKNLEMPYILEKFPIKNIKIRGNKTFKEATTGVVQPRAFYRPSTKEVFVRRWDREALRTPRALSHEIDHYYQDLLGNNKKLKIKPNSELYNKVVEEYNVPDIPIYRNNLVETGEVLNGIYTKIPKANLVSPKGDPLYPTEFNNLFDLKKKAWYQSPNEFISETAAFTDTYTGKKYNWGTSTPQQGEIYRNLTDNNKAIVKKALSKRFEIPLSDVNSILESAPKMGYLKYGGLIDKRRKEKEI